PRARAPAASHMRPFRTQQPEQVLDDPRRAGPGLPEQGGDLPRRDREGHVLPDDLPSERLPETFHPDLDAHGHSRRGEPGAGDPRLTPGPRHPDCTSAPSGRGGPLDERSITNGTKGPSSPLNRYRSRTHCDNPYSAV